MGGICPGPGVVALATLQPQALLFVAALTMGMALDSTMEQVVCAVQKRVAF